MNYKAKVYLVGDDERELVPLEETGFIQESDLQELLANYPDLIPGDQIDPENPRRWILVSREMGIPAAEDEGNRWSLDHLFLDQDGIPTFIECKRASDTRIRREVVAQMLEYAANGVEYWNVDRLRQVASEVSQSRNTSLDEEIIELLGDDADLTSVEDYWDTVERNLKERKVRLIFVADSTPKELRRLVEFLNEEMANIEVLAVEIKSYKGIGSNKSQALVPRVIGLTETIRSKKKKTSSVDKKLTPADFFEKCAPEATSFFKGVIRQAEKRNFVVRWGHKGFSIRAKLRKNGALSSFVYVKLPDEFQFYFDGESFLSRNPISPFRIMLKDLGVFSESGEHTLIATVSNAGEERLQEIYENIILEKIDSLLEKHA